ncbi:MAG: histidine phosphatase family protein [Paracoccaceae bacterium]
MTLRLILTRHAKSSWDDQSIEDHDRPLNKRGRTASRDIGEWLAQHDYIPDLVLCSTAARTRATWEIISTALPRAPEVQFERALYLATPEQILGILQKVQGAQTVMMLGHNPGISLAATALAARPPHHARFAQYPTAATTVYQFDNSDWGRVAWGQGDVLAFTLPRGED